MTAAGPPIACTLTADAFEARTAWIRDLARDFLIAHRRNGMALHLIYAPEAVADVRALVAREQACCAFLAFELSIDADAVRLVVSAPDETKGVAELLFEELALPAKGRLPGPITPAAGPRG